MESKIYKELKMKFYPVAVLFSNELPENALRFKDGKWGCVMSMFAQSAIGKTVAFDINSYGCNSGAIALGFDKTLEDFQGGTNRFYHFISCGQNEDGSIEGLQQIEGEHYLKSPEIVKEMFDKFPYFHNNSKYVVFKPMTEVKDNETPEVVAFPVNANQLSALVFLANYDRPDNEAVYAPFGAGCHCIGLHVIAEKGKEKQRAIIGLTDPSARLFSSSVLGNDILTFAVTNEFFNKMESNVENSFLQHKTWKKLIGS